MVAVLQSALHSCKFFIIFLLLQTQFLVGGVCLKDFIETQKLDHVQQLEAEKHAREKQKKETLLQETRFQEKVQTNMELEIG